MLSDADAQSVRHAVGVLITLLIGCGARLWTFFLCNQESDPSSICRCQRVEHWLLGLVPQEMATVDGSLQQSFGSLWIHVVENCGIRRWHRKMRLPFWSTHYICPCFSLFASCQRCQFALQTEVVILTNMGYTVFDISLLDFCFIVWFDSPNLSLEEKQHSSQAGRFWQCHNCSWHLHPAFFWLAIRMVFEAEMFSPFQCGYPVAIRGVV